MFSTLHELILDKTARMGDDTAVVDEFGNTLSYAELQKYSAIWSDVLLKKGVTAGDRIGVSVSRTASLPCVLLAILRAGCCWVPLDPGYPMKWRDFVQQDATVKLLIHDACITNEQKQSGIDYIDINDLPFESTDALTNEPTVSKDNVCYIIYTSGSTGVPKGVMITHANTVNFIEWTRETYPQKELARVLCSTSICFDLSLFEIFGTLSAGGVCCMVKNALSLLSLPESHHLTLINTVPSVMRELLRHEALPSQNDIVVNLAGESLGVELVKALYSCPNVIRVVNLYGPSETTTYSTYDVIARDETVPTVGQSIKETQIHLLDNNLNDVVDGEVGEIHISGAGVAAGYINKADLTAQRFILLNTLEYGEIRAYKTGDLGRWRPDGKLEYLGRADDQVKVRGFRIELQHIEDALVRLPHIQDAAVIVAFPGQDNVSLCAWVMTDDIAKFTSQHLRQRLSNELPAHMIPEKFNYSSSLPRLPNGKINRKVLRERSEEAARRLINENIDDTLSEHYFLKGLLQSITGVNDFSDDTDIFTLGINSLSILKITAELNNKYGVLLPVSVVHHSPTVNGILKHIARMSGIEMEMNTVEDVLPAVTEAQLQMYYLSQLTDNDPSNNIIFSMVLNSQAVENDVEYICDALWQSSPLMRASLPAGKQWTGIKVRPPIKYYRGKFTTRDIENIKYDASRVELDPDNSCLWQMSVIEHEFHNPVIILTLHHLLVDDVSLQIIFHCLEKVLTKRYHHTHFISPYLVAKHNDEELSHREWWHSKLKKKIAPVRPSLLITDAVDEFDSRTLRVRQTISSELYKKILLRCEQRGATLYEFLLSCLVFTLSNREEHQNIMLATIMSVRKADVNAADIGFYGNLLPLVLATRPATPGEDILDATVAVVRATSQHSSVSSNWLQGELRQHSQAQNLQPVMFGCIRSFSSRIDPQVATVDELNTGHAHSFLSCQVRFSEQALQLFIDGRMNIYTEAYLQQLINDWSEGIRQVLNAVTNEGAETHE